MTLQLHRPESDIAARLEHIRLVLGERRAEVRLRRCRPAGRHAWALEVPGVDSREVAASWTHAEVLAPRGLFPPAAPGEYYSFELEGLLARRPDGTPFGVVAGLEDFGGGVLLVLRRDGDLMYLPFAAPHVGAIDREAGTVVVDPSGFEDMGGGGAR